MTSRRFCDGCGEELGTVGVVQVHSLKTHDHLDFCNGCAGIGDDRDIRKALREGFNVADE